MKYKTALITGASSGIGASFAHALAVQGSDLILVARSEDKLQSLARELRTAHQRRVEVIAADLSAPSPGARVASGVAKLGMNVDLLINNAGFGAAGAFHKVTPQRHQEMIALNMSAVVDLTHAFLPGMVQRGAGGIINLASAAAFQPIPFMSVYAASKAFVLALSEGLNVEYRNKGIRVVAVCPGPVNTPFFEATGSAELRARIPVAMMMTADAVVRDALKALKSGRAVVVPGSLNKLMTTFPRFVPRDWVAKAVGRSFGH